MTSMLKSGKKNTGAGWLSCTAQCPGSSSDRLAIRRQPERISCSGRCSGIGRALTIRSDQGIQSEESRRHRKETRRLRWCSGTKCIEQQFIIICLLNIFIFRPRFSIPKGILRCIFAQRQTAFEAEMLVHVDHWWIPCLSTDTGQKLGGLRHNFIYLIIYSQFSCHQYIILLVVSYLLVAEGGEL